MALQLCSRCLHRAASRPTLEWHRSRIWPSNTPLALFSTSTSLHASILKKKSVVVPGRRGPPVRGRATNFKMKKKKAPGGRERGKRPAMGERKAWRKRVVLSNTNALIVRGLQELTMETIKNDAMIGSVVSIPGPVVDRLRAVEAFKPSQGWSLFRTPAMLIREETFEYGRLIDEIDDGDTEQDIRRVFVGERGSGKTVMLLQAMAMAMVKDWVVINIPDAKEITMANTEYAPLPGTTPTVYVQPTFTASLLSAIQRANPVLDNLKLSEDAQAQAKAATASAAAAAAAAAARASNSNAPPSQQTISYTELPPFPPTTTLAGLCKLGSESPQHSHALFTLLLSELKQPARPPLLLALDGLGFTMRDTKYIDGRFYKPIHAHDFSLIRFFLSHLSGREKLGPSGGMVLAAISESNRPRVEALDLALGQIEQSASPSRPLIEELGGGIPYPAPGTVARNPFKHYDERVMSVFESPSSSSSSSSSSSPSFPSPSSTATSPSAAAAASILAGTGGISVHRINGLARDEARSLMEYWARSGIVHSVIDDGYVGEKWTLAGGGIVGELERCVVRGRA